jgi:hypothetical protein
MDFTNKVDFAKIYRRDRILRKMKGLKIEKRKRGFKLNQS